MSSQISDRENPQAQGLAGFLLRAVPVMHSRISCSAATI
jgi:hypothetical protein